VVSYGDYYGLLALLKINGYALLVVCNLCIGLLDKIVGVFESSFSVEIDLTRSELCAWMLQPVSVFKIFPLFFSPWLITFDPMGCNMNCWKI